MLKGLQAQSLPMVSWRLTETVKLSPRRFSAGLNCRPVNIAHSMGAALVQERKSELWLLLSVVALTVTFLLLRIVFLGFDEVLFADNDDAMRMVVVRDFLAGQSWFDHAQYRLDTPYGGDMHWSRLVDLPIAALILLARPFAGTSAEIVAGYLWPVILLTVLVWLNGRLTLRLVGRDGLLPGMLIGAFSVVTLSEFSFGRMDHHSVQIILTQVAVLFAINSLEKPRAGAGAGLAAATALAIGTESLPVVVASILVYGLFFVLQPALYRAVRWFGVAFGLGTIGHLLLALSPSLWFTPACDAISIVYATAAFGAGAMLFGLTFLPLARQSWLVRLAIGAVAGGAVVALVAILFPACLDGPYAIVDPWLVENWLGVIGEAKPLFAVIPTNPDFVFGAGVPALLALVAALHAAWHSDGSKRSAWLILALVLAVIIAVALVQVRSIRLTLALVAPACAYWVVLARQRYLERSSLSRILGLVGSWLGFAGALWAMLAYATTAALSAPVDAAAQLPQTDRQSCLKPSGFQELAALTPTRIMTPLDLGAYILLYTQHDVLSAPYHRNNQALLDTFAILNGPIETAYDILQQRGITLIVTCPTLYDMVEPHPAGSLVELLRVNTLPDWLEQTRIGESGPLDVYAVRPR